MELANIAFHAETPGRYSVLGKYMRKIKLREKVDNLFDENRGKRAILRRYLRDAVRHVDFTDLEDIANESDFDEYVNTLDCAFEEPNSENTTDKHVSYQKYIESGYIHDRQDFSECRNSSSSTLVSNDIDLVRECGDGTEVPDLADDKFSKGDTNSERVVIGTEECNRSTQRQMIQKRIIEGADDICISKFRRVATEKYVNTESKYHCKSGSTAFQKAVKCECNGLAITRKRLKDKTTDKLKGLLNLYKTMKTKRKMAKKCIAGNLTCLTPIKSRTCLNSAFISAPADNEVPGNTKFNVTSIGNDRLCFNGTDESTSNVRFDSAFMSNSSNSTCNILNAAFISSYPVNSHNNTESGSTDIFTETQGTMDYTVDKNDDELNFAKLDIHSRYLSLGHNTTNCSSRYEDFVYFNNGFVMD